MNEKPIIKLSDTPTTRIEEPNKCETEKKIICEKNIDKVLDSNFFNISYVKALIFFPILLLLVNAFLFPEVTTTLKNQISEKLKNFRQIDQVKNLFNIFDRKAGRNVISNASLEKSLQIIEKDLQKTSELVDYHENMTQYFNDQYFKEVETNISIIESSISTLIVSSNDFLEQYKSIDDMYASSSNVTTAHQASLAIVPYSGNLQEWSNKVANISKTTSLLTSEVKKISNRADEKVLRDVESLKAYEQLQIKVKNMVKNVIKTKIDKIRSIYAVPDHNHVLDKIQIDYSALSRGGTIFKENIKESFDENNSLLPFTSPPLITRSKVAWTRFTPFQSIESTDPNMVLSFTSPKIGNCYAFSGSTGAISVLLPLQIIPRNFELLHLSEKNEALGNNFKYINGSAPLSFSLFGWTDAPKTTGFLFNKKTTYGEKIFLGKYTYDISQSKKSPWQSFEISNLHPDFQNKGIRMFSILIHSNNGNNQFNCVYRIKLLGLTLNIIV